MVEGPKVIGKIHIPDDYKSECTCDDCGYKVNDKFGDPRVEITTLINRTVTSVRWICQYCADELFGDGESHSIFE